MKTEFLFAKLNRMPMLKAVVPFAAGILLSEYYLLPAWFLVATLLTTGVAALLLRSPFCALTMLLTAGFGVAQLRTTQPSLPRDLYTTYTLSIEGIPADRGRYTAAEGVVTAWRNPLDGRWLAANDRILIRADSLIVLQGGEQLLCRGKVRSFRSGSASFRQLMIRRGFVGNLWLAERDILERLPTDPLGLHARAAHRLAKLGLSGNAGAVCRAMTVADRSDITPALRATYARSGFSHLLAVSGLHTGIVFLLINWALWWLPLLRRGHLIRNVAAAASIWFFVAAAGFPPSAVRAGVMCTLLQFTHFSGSEYNGLNTLAMAAFGMLLYQPAWLGDLSFQLSFLAVAAILAWGVPLCRRLHTRWRGANLLIDALAISLVATLATAPLVSHTFGIIALTGILLNPVAIALASVVVLGGVVWLVAPIDLLAPLFRGIITPIADALNALAHLSATFPNGVLAYNLPTLSTVAVYLFFGLATLALWSIEPKKSVHLRR
ncbi:MAG: ComEC/Rec2 family competence protein [Alistipes sp.]